jgi:hypothetical protein
MPQFSSLPDSMYYLFLSAALGDDITDFAQAVRDRSLLMTMMLFVLVVLANQVIVSLLGGLMVDIITELRGNFKEAQKKTEVGEQLQDVVTMFDRLNDGDGKISRGEYNKLMKLMQSQEAAIELEGAYDGEKNEFPVRKLSAGAKEYLQRLRSIWKDARNAGNEKDPDAKDTKLYEELVKGFYDEDGLFFHFEEVLDYEEYKKTYWKGTQIFSGKM